MLIRVEKDLDFEMRKEGMVMTTGIERLETLLFQQLEIFLQTTVSAVEAKAEAIELLQEVYNACSTPHRQMYLATLQRIQEADRSVFERYNDCTSTIAGMPFNQRVLILLFTTHKCLCRQDPVINRL